MTKFESVFVKMSAQDSAAPVPDVHPVLNTSFARVSWVISRDIPRIFTASESLATMGFGIWHWRFTTAEASNFPIENAFATAVNLPQS